MFVNDVDLFLKYICEVMCVKKKNVHLVNLWFFIEEKTVIFERVVCDIIRISGGARTCIEPLCESHFRFVHVSLPYTHRAWTHLYAELKFIKYQIMPWVLSVCACACFHVCVRVRVK